MSALLDRMLRMLPAIWLGGLAAIAWVAAPALFATLDRQQAGLAAGRIFSIEAPLSLAFGATLLVLERRAAEQQALAGSASRFTLNMVLALVALFSVVVGYYGLQPLMHEARAGRGPHDFALLHGISMAFYALRTVAVAALAWRRAAA